jgi:hypothetical protein
MTKRSPNTPTVNQAEQNQLKILSSLQALASVRRELAEQAGYQYGTQRDVYRALGYKVEPRYEDYYGLFKRGGIARTILTAYPDATWKGIPELVAPNAGEGWWKAWNEMAKQLRIFSYCRRVDVLANIGHYAVLFLGLNDSMELDQPVTPSTRLKLAYLSCYSEASAKIDSYVQDPQDPRFGLPEFYSIQMDMSEYGQTVAPKAESTGTGPQMSSKTTKVHWSRCIHVAEGLLESEVYGEPRGRAVYNYLDDLLKVSGGGAEMFWRGAFPGLAFVMDPDISPTPEQKADMATQIDDYVHNLQRILRLQGVEPKTLSSAISSPKAHYDVLIDLIAGTARIPKRILIGSERGELASSQDEGNWASRIQERQELFAGPDILLALVNRLIDLKVLKNPGEELSVLWPDQRQKNDKEVADINNIRATILTTYFNSGLYEIIPLELFLFKFLSMTQDEITEMKEEYPDMFVRIDLEEEEEPEAEADEEPAQEEEV